jgi:hypothetical protein
VDTHIAVVPVAALDHQTRLALAYASKLAPEVMGLHLQSQTATNLDRIEDAWSKSGLNLPLVIVDAVGESSASAFSQVLEVLKRTRHVDQITLVLPANTTDKWLSGLNEQSGVAIALTPERTR